MEHEDTKDDGVVSVKIKSNTWRDSVKLSCLKTAAKLERADTTIKQ